MAEDVSILSEIDEALRADKVQQLWARYSGAVITFCALCVIASAASVIWRNHLHELHERQTQALSEAVSQAQAGSYDQAVAGFEKIESEGGTLAGYAGIRHAETLLRMKQDDTALALYNDIAAGRRDDAIPPVRNFAVYQAAVMTRNLVSPKTKPSYTPTPDAGVFRAQVAELDALSALKAGDTKSATALLDGILHDGTASLSERTRAARLLAAGKDGK